MSTLVDQFRERTEAGPHRMALTFLPDGEDAGHRLDYAATDLRARAVGAHLGPFRGERALMLYPSGTEFVTAFLGCLYAGVIAVPAYPPRSDKHLGRLNAIVADAQATLVLAPGELCDRLGDKAFPGARLVATDRLPDDLAGGWRHPGVTAGDVAFLQYTSGSTGAPKGVMLTHANLLGNGRLLADAARHTPQPVHVSWLPLFHDMGLIAKLLQAFHWHSELVFMPPAAFLQEPIRWLRAISEYGGTISGAPNFAYDLCVRRTTPQQRAGLDLSSWQVAYNAAEPVRADTLRTFAETFAPYGFRPETSFPCYGLAENAVFVCGGPPSRPPVVSTVDLLELEQNRVRPGVHPLVGCGRESGDQRIRIVGPDGAVLGPDAVGEVWTSGSSTAKGYWRRPEESATVFGGVLAGVPGTWLRTGDLGFLDSSGELYLTGRLKDLVILHGRNVYPQDLERTAEQAHPALRPGCGAAFSVDFDVAERLVLVYEVREDATDIGAAVAAALTEQHDVALHDLVLIRARSIAKTSSGKIARRACRQSYLDGSLDVVSRWSPALLEDRVRNAVRDRLGHGIAPEQGFASAGVDSVTAVAISGDLQRVIGRKLPATLLYDHPTPEAVARFLAGEREVARTGRSISDEAIAVVGIGCRFPGAPSPAAFWDLLDRGGEAITERDGAGGGFLDDVADFDPEFFGIAPSEAIGIDPQQRLLLEVAWEALEHAGIAPTALAGTRTGVFVGISNNDYARLLGDRLNAHYGTGNALSIAANRLSYQLDLRGPSIAVDTACSSSLVAVHQACASLRSGESDVALAAGVNLILAPHLSSVFRQAQMLAPDGRCKTFSDDADGYVRSEGCGVVVLKPLSTALADGDEVLALIRGSAVNQDGRSNGLTAPSGQAQRAVVTEALAAAGVRPAEVGYVEAHGTGTPLGDPIEYAALADVLGENERCLLGSVKTNIGHLESAAGIAGLIKVVLALRHNRIPAHRNLTRLNSHIDAARSPLEIPVESADWPREWRVAGVSSFGFGGTNAHVVVAQAPEVAHEVLVRDEYVLELSARSEAALNELVLLYVDRLADDVTAADLCHTANTGRARFEHRLTVAGRDVGELTAGLAAFLVGRHDTPAGEPTRCAGRRIPLPTYPFQRTRLWLPDKAPAPRRGHPLLGQRQPGQQVWQQVVAPGDIAVFDDHRIQGQVVAPGVSFVEMALAAAHELTGVRHTVEQVEFRSMLGLTASRVLRVAIAEDLTFTVHSEQSLHATGKLVASDLSPGVPADLRGEELDVTEFYEQMSANVTYGPSMRCVRQVWLSEGEAFARLAAPPDMADYELHPALLDTGFHLLGLLAGDVALALPVGIDRVRVHRRPEGSVLCHARQDGTVRLSDTAGVFAEADGMRLRILHQAPDSGPVERIEPGQVGNLLRSSLAGVLGVAPECVDPHCPMIDLGLDSLMSMDLLGDVKRDLGVNVPAVQVLSGASLEELTASVLDELAAMVDDVDREEFVL